MRYLVPAVLFIALEILLALQFLATSDPEGRVLIVIAGLGLVSGAIVLGRRLFKPLPPNLRPGGPGDVGGSDAGYDSHDNHHGDGGGDGH